MTAPISNGPATTRLHHYAGHYSQNADFGPLSGCWANFVTLGLQTDHAGRTLYRIRGLCRDKALPARPKAPIAAHFPHAGRVLYRFRHHQTKQGEKSHARAAPREAGQALTAPGTP